MREGRLLSVITYWVNVDTE